MQASTNGDQRVNILLVDDRAENLVALKAALADLGQNLVTARSGVEALKHLLDDEFAVVVLDVHMPGMGGLEAAALMRERERTRYTPIIFLTAMYKNEQDMFRGYSVGAADYMFTPFAPEVLRAKVAAFVGLSQLRHQLESQLEETRRLNQKLDEANRELAHSQAMLRGLNETLEQRVGERTRELSAVLSIAREMASTLELEPLLSVILEQLKAMVDYTGVAIYLLEGEGLSVVEYQGSMPRSEALRVRLQPDSAAGCAEVFRSRGAVVIHDLAGDSPRAIAWRECAADPQKNLVGDARSWLGVPLLVKDEVIGILALYHQMPEYFTSRSVEISTAIASHAGVAIENARLYRRVQQAAALEERQRLARELHDSVSQVLYGIGLGTRTARSVLDEDLDKAAAALDYVLNLATAGLAEMRALIFELHPESLEKEGLVSALTKQAESLQVRRELAVTVELCEEPALPLEAKEGLYRIAQEAMHNTVKHAHARAIDLRLNSTGEVVILDVADDGRGFDPEGFFPGHLGLRSMRERAARLGGSLELVSAPGKGTHVHVTVPVSAAIAAEAGA